MHGKCSVQGPAIVGANKNTGCWGNLGAQSVKHPTSDLSSGLDLRIVGSNPSLSIKTTIKKKKKYWLLLLLSLVKSSITFFQVAPLAFAGTLDFSGKKKRTPHAK